MILRTTAREGGAPAGIMETGGERYAKRLGHVVGGLRGLGKIIVLGGETAYFMMRILRIKELEVVEEVIQGVPLCTSSGLSIITKAGGFGTEDTLIDLYRFLKNRK